MIKQKQKNKDLREINFFKDSEIYVSDMDEIYFNYDNLRQYVLVRTRAYAKVTYNNTFEDITHNIIIRLSELFENIRLGKNNKSNLAFKDDKVHILYIKKMIKFEILVLLRNSGIKLKHISNGGDIGDLINKSLTSFADLELEDKLEKELYLHCLDQSLLEIEEYERLLIEYSELISTIQISEITGLDYNYLIKEINSVRKKLKVLVTNKVKNNIELEKLKRIYE